MANTEHKIGKQYIEELLKEGYSPNPLYSYCKELEYYEPAPNMEELYKVVEESLRTGKKIIISPIPDTPHDENEIVFWGGVRRYCPDLDLAMFYESRGLFEDALTHYEMAIKKGEDPTGVAYRDAGYLCLHKLKDFDRALYFFTNLGRESAEDNEYIAELYMESGRYEEALEIYNRFFPILVFNMLTFIYSATSEDYGETALEFDRMAVCHRCDNIEHCYAMLHRTPDGWYKSCRDYFNLMSSKEYFQKRGNVVLLNNKGKKKVD